MPFRVDAALGSREAAAWTRVCESGVSRKIDGGMFANRGLYAVSLGSLLSDLWAQAPDLLFYNAPNRETDPEGSASSRLCVNLGYFKHAESNFA